MRDRPFRIPAKVETLNPFDPYGELVEKSSISTDISDRQMTQYLQAYIGHDPDKIAQRLNNIGFMVLGIADVAGYSFKMECKPNKSLNLKAKRVK